jgi:hypothetical protein
MATMRRSALLFAAFGLALSTAPAAWAQSGYHVQLQVNRYSETISAASGIGSCRIDAGVIGTFPDSPARLAIGTPVNLTIPCALPSTGAAGRYSRDDLSRASFLEARLAGRPGAFELAGQNALVLRPAPVALPAAPVSPPVYAPPVYTPPQQVLVAPTAPTIVRPVMPLPPNPVAPSRPLVIGQPSAPVPVPAPPGPAFVPQPPGYVPAAPGGPVDSATMRSDASIMLTYGPASAAETGLSQRLVRPTDPAYPGLLSQLGGIAPGQTKPLPRPVATVPLVPNAVPGDKLRSLLVGNSLTGTDIRYNQQGPWTEYYDPSGVVTRAETTRHVVGSWAVRGDSLCTRYPGQAETCLTLSTTATALRGYAGATLIALDLRILPGNAIRG